ncbi:MAG: esterase-like activity of phytase family protein [Pseudomonadota bacterium]|nr:esterase-like activity of phytase family protein [Pseudomonadota bacterium]
MNDLFGSPRRWLGLGLAALAVPAAAQALGSGERYFERVATFPVFENTSIDTDTVAEIVAAARDGTLLVYTDGENGAIGLVDITDPAAPTPAGNVPVGGEPTSVAVLGDYALTAVNTSASFTAPSGELAIIDLNARRIVRTLALPGQPDAVAVSPDGRYAAIAIENERDEDIEVDGVEGGLPQLPAGALTIVDLLGEPADWGLRTVALTGLPIPFAADPEPEYVAINALNVAAVTLQENNAVVLVFLPTGRVIRAFDAGSVDLTGIDVEENERIELTGSLSQVPREPDGIAWVSPFVLATADEGDLFGGSRGFTLFGNRGRVLSTSGNTLDQAAVRLGHYPENRSENKGSEPENVAYARYGKLGKDRLLFVGAERSNLLFVYEVDPFGQVDLLQILPTGVAPEGILPIPGRDLLVVAAEEDSRDDKIRSSLTIYRRHAAAPAYPTIASADTAAGTPIPWGALSGLAVDPAAPRFAWSVADSFYEQSRIFRLDLDATPALLDSAITLTDPADLLATVDAEFDARLVNADDTVNLDLEGIALAAAGGFWLVSEGAGTVGDADRPVESPNLLLQGDASGAITRVVRLPASVEARQRRFGFEGVAEADGLVYVAFQRAWAGDPADRARIGRFDPATGSWAFYYYPLEAPSSPNGGWVGLSDLTYLGSGRFAVIERDNQAGADARIKRLFSFSIDGLTPLADPAAGTTPSFPLLPKAEAADLLPALTATGGPVLEKIEGLAAIGEHALIVNDNDGVDDSRGETQLLRLDTVFD